MAASLRRVRIPFLEVVDRKSVLGLLRLPRRSDVRGGWRRSGAGYLCAAEFPGQSVHTFCAICVLSFAANLFWRKYESTDETYGQGNLGAVALRGIRRFSSACKGADGKGETTVGKANKVRDLGSADVQGQSDDVIVGIIANGKGKMPAYGKSL